MIEVIYKDDKQEEQEKQDIFRIPRNVRQIGAPAGGYRIYMEDYVFTFLSGMSKEAEEKGNEQSCLAILAGNVKWEEETAFLFINGAILAELQELCAEHISFTEENWQNILKEKEEYFPEEDIVGWFFGNAQWGAETAQLFTKVHLKYFGADKVFMLMDASESEDGFFRVENECLIRQRGYYIYYEKNPQMQSYMIDKKQVSEEEEQEKTEDKAVQKFRRIIKGKEKEKVQETEEKPSVFSYAATACLALAVLAVGVNFYRDYDRAEMVSLEKMEVVSEEKKVNTEDEAMKEKTNTNKIDENEFDAGSNDLTKTESSKEDAETRKQQIYQEESDVRKAQRREQLEERQTENEKTPTGMPAKTDEEGAEQQDGVKSDLETSVQQKTYVICPGDTLYQISMEKYGTAEAIKEICSLNNISQEEIIYPGQVIVLP